MEKVALLLIPNIYSWQQKPAHSLHKQAQMDNLLLDLFNRTRGSRNAPNNFSARSLSVEKTIMLQLGEKSEAVLNFCKGL